MSKTRSKLLKRIRETPGVRQVDPFWGDWQSIIRDIDRGYRNFCRKRGLELEDMRAQIRAGAEAGQVRRRALTLARLRGMDTYAIDADYLEN